MHHSSLLLACALSAIASTALAAGQFRTVGTTIFDPDGVEFIAHGINVAGFNHWTGHDPSGDADLIADAWGFNLVRVNSLPVSAPTFQGAHIRTEDIVDAFTTDRIARGKKPVVVMLTPHESTGNHFEGQQLQNVAAWFRHYSNLYKDNPYVWFNVGNEPGYLAKPADWPAEEFWDIFQIDQAKWETMHQTVIRAIRHDVGSRNMIVADGAGYGQDSAWDDLGTLAVNHSAIIPYGKNLIRFDDQTYENILFDLHVYGMWVSEGSTPGRLRDYLDAVRAQNLPLIIAEYSPNGVGTYKAIDDMRALADEYRIGRAAWHWADFGDHDDLTTGVDPNVPGSGWGTGGGYLIDSPENPTNLTTYGQYLWDDNRTDHGPLKRLVIGDANIDGAINADDYAILDRGIAQGLVGWLNGDFDYDGAVDPDDYLLLDAAFFAQSGNVLSPEVLAERQSRFGPTYAAALTAAIPEPTALAPIILTAAALASRRRRGPKR